MALGVALVGVGATGAVGSSSAGRPSARVVSGNRPIDPGATDPLDVRALNSPVVRMNPRNPANLVTANRVDRPSFSCAVWSSFDGGASWAEVPIPTPEAVTRCFSPDLAFGADGSLYLSFTSFAQVPGQGTVPDAVWLVRSEDGGQTLTGPVRISGPLAFEVHVATDPETAGRLYLTWVQAEGAASWGFSGPGNPIVVVRSDDGGATWSAPARVSPPERPMAMAPSPAVGARGEVFVSYLDLGDDRLDYEGAHEGLGGPPYAGPWSLVVARSTDMGATWSESVVAPALVPTQRLLVLFPPRPALAVDRARRRVYVGFHDGGADPSDVLVWASTDGGRHWLPPTRVNDTRRGDGTSQYLSQLAVAPNGRLDVAYYDRRADTHDTLNDVSLQSSFDAGRHFTPRVRVSDRSFDSGIGMGSDRQMPELGDRLGLVSTNGRALAVWADTRAGTRSDGKQNLASAVIAIDAPSGLPRVLRALGLGTAAVGVALIGLGWARRRKTGRHELAEPLAE